MSLWCHLDRFRPHPSKFPPIRSKNANIYVWADSQTKSVPPIRSEYFVWQKKLLNYIEDLIELVLKRDWRCHHHLHSLVRFLQECLGLWRHSLMGTASDCKRLTTLWLYSVKSKNYGKIIKEDKISKIFYFYGKMRGILWAAIFEWIIS